MMKFVPGAGSVVGGIIGTGLATELTWQIDRNYLNVLVELTEEGYPLELNEAIIPVERKLGL